VEVAERVVGGRTGTATYEFKGGIETSLRRFDLRLRPSRYFTCTIKMGLSGSINNFQLEEELGVTCSGSVGGTEIRLYRFSS